LRKIVAFRDWLLEEVTADRQRLSCATNQIDVARTPSGVVAAQARRP
jgi:hypothetical protein